MAWLSAKIRSFSPTIYRRDSQQRCRINCLNCIMVGSALRLNLNVLHQRAVGVRNRVRLYFATRRTTIEAIAVAGERILVVDDSKENREFIIDYILKPNGFEVIEARDGVEGMELARIQSPDLILLDLQMPRLDGMGVLQALRRENLPIPVILMTFHGSEEIAIEVFRMGVRDYVKKPYTPEEMLTAIEGNLTETRLRKEKDALTSRLLNANRELHNRIKELNTLYSIGKSVTALLNPTQLLARVVEAATVVTSAELGSLLLVESDNLGMRAFKRSGDTHT